MAELRLDLSKIDRDLELQYDDGEDILDDDDDCVDEIDPLMDDLSPDDQLAPLDKLQKYFQSEDVGERDIALRMIPEAVQSITSFADFDLLLDIVFALANDYEPCIRINVLGNIPSLLEKNASLDGEGQEYAPETEARLFGIPIKMLVDINQQVRRASQNSIVNLLEEEKGTKDVFVEQLCPTIKRCLGRDENYDLRMDTVMMLGRISVILGHDVIVNNFVSILPSLALDTMFHVRKAFAMSCRELCPVLGEDDSEQHVLPLFFKLCKDEVWGVRKACADVFTDVSASCNLGTRHDKLTPVYLSLLHDDSRWVRKAAFQSLGAFISTFYIPNGNNSPDLDESNFAPLSDSVLQDNSLLDTVDLTSCESTNDASGENRHPPIEQLPASSNSSTPLRAGFKSKATNQNTESNKEEIEFVKSEISQTSSEESMDQLSQALQNMRVEDIETKDPQNENLSCDQSEENDILDSAIKKIDVTGQNSTSALVSVMDNPLLVHPPSVGSVKINPDMGRGELETSDRGGEAEEARTETTGQSTATGLPTPQIMPTTSTSVDTTREETEKQSIDEVKDQASSSVDPEPVEVDGTTGQTSSKPVCQAAKPSRLTELLTDDSIRLRSSSEGSSFKSYFDSVFKDDSSGKKRRWSMDKESQVRVFVHSTSGKVTEQDLSVVDQEPHPLPDTPPHNKEFDLVGHNASTTHSVAMDLTLDGVESVPSDPNLMRDLPGQEVVPDELMEIYLSMTEHAKAQVVDTDLPYYCAFSLPGVALTLGQEHWRLVKPTFDLLAGDMQWKIRRVLAFSLHELAKVVGTDNTCTDILPIFEEYCTKDIDDVKIGAMSHLAEFFELLPVALRSKHLPGVLNGLQDMENDKNWRYRNLLAEQLILLCDMFECDFLETHVYPAALTLAEDKVAEVRSTATQVLGVILQKLSQTNLEKCRLILRQLKSYGSNEKWLYRLMYVKQCETFLLDGRISCELFASECLPILLLLARDKVPNVRIAVARMLKDSVLKIDYFQTETKDTFSLEELQITLECLQHDQDRDVKYFAGGEVSDTRRLVKLPVQWYAQRHRSESFQSQGSNDYHDAQEYFETEDLQRGQPLSLTMAGMLANTPQNHQKSPTQLITASLASEPIREETEAVSKTAEISQDSIVAAQDTTEAAQDTTVTAQDNTAAAQDTTAAAQDTTAAAQDTTAVAQDTRESELDSTKETQDTRENVRDTTGTNVDSSKVERDSETQSQDTTEQTELTPPESLDTITGNQDITPGAQDTTSPPATLED